MHKKIRLLIVAKSIDGGSGTFISELIHLSELSSRIEISGVLVLEKPVYRTSFENKSLYRFNHEKGFYPGHYSFSVRNIFRFFADYRWLHSWINREKPDVILSVDVHCNLLSLIAKSLFYPKKKFIITTHINESQTIFDRSSRTARTILRNLIRYFYDKADTHVCVSRQLAESMKQNFSLKRPVISIYNGTQLKTFGKMKRSNKKFTIITVARLVEQKDHTTLLKAFSRIQKKIHDSRLWILSDGPMKKTLVNFVKKHNIPNVFFYGWVRDIYSYLRKADIFVLSSRREGFNYALIEAMSQSLPVISTRTPYGPAEVLAEGKYGTLISVGDSRAMSAALLNLYSHPEKSKYFGEQSLMRSTFFTRKKMLKAYRDIIISLT